MSTKLNFEQRQRASLIAESRGIDDDTAFELVYLRDKAAELSTPTAAPLDARIRRHEISPERWEELQAALDRPTGPTEEEAEEVLCHYGTSGKEVVNGFIERLMRENLELKQRLAATPTQPETPLADLAKACPVCGWIGINDND